MSPDCRLKKLDSDLEKRKPSEIINYKELQKKLEINKEQQENYRKNIKLEHYNKNL